jgi:translocation and assembly module TamA
MSLRLSLVACSLATVAWLAPAVAAEIEVEFTGVEGPLLENLRALSSLQRLSKSQDLNDEMVGRLVQRAPGEAQLALRPFGYYEPRVATNLVKTEKGWRASVKVDPGKPVVLVERRIAITGSGRDQPFMKRALAQQSTLATGQRLSHPAYETLKAGMLRAAQSRGYLDAHFTRSELAVDPATHTASAFLTLETGERYRFGPTTIEQSVIKEGLVRRFVRFREGDWYDAGSLLRTQFALDDSQYFSLVEVTQDERDRKSRVVPIRITAQPNRRHAYTVGAGYGTDTGPRGTLGFEDRRLNQSGHRLHAEVRGSEIDTSGGVTYVVPWSDPAVEKLAYELRVFLEQRADVETTGSRFRTSLTQVRGNWQRVLSVALERTEDSVIGSTVNSPLVNESKSTLVVPGITYARLPPGFLGVDAVATGFRAELLGASSALGSDIDFTRILVSDQRLFRLTSKWAIQVRGEIGASVVDDFAQLPATYRFFAGGDQSVRGYGYQELSPVDRDGNKVGGRHLITASVELQRSLPRNFVAAVFMDAGNAIDRFGDPIEYSAGVGLRYRLPFLSIGIDVAKSISEPERSPRLHLNFTPEF